MFSHYIVELGPNTENYVKKSLLLTTHVLEILNNT